MEEQSIELRSEKVRNIVGKMPSVLIRYGIGMIFAILTLIVVGSIFFRFTPTYDVPAQVSINASDTIIRIEIPVQIKQSINIGNTAVVSFDNIPGTEKRDLQVKVYYIDSVMCIDKSSAYYYAYCNIIDSLITQKIETDGFVFEKAQTSGTETSLFDFVIEKIFRGKQ